MSVDSRNFRKTLGCFATGVTVVTTNSGTNAGTGSDGAGAKPVGVTVNAFTSVSLDPPLVAFCLGRNSVLFDAFSGAETFVVNILAADQAGLSQHFASRQTQGVWDGVATQPSGTDAPALAGVTGFIACARENVLDGGDHAIIIGRVLNVFAAEEVKPLLYFRGRYEELAASAD